MQISSEHKELGPNTIARRPSDFLTGVPIKKRRFPFIRPPSPPPQIPSPTEDEQEQLLTSKPESPTLTSASPSVSGSKEQSTLNPESSSLPPGSPNFSEPKEQSTLNPESSSLPPASPNFSEPKEQSTLNPESSSLTVTSPLLTDQSTCKTQSSSLTADSPAEFDISAGNSTLPSSSQKEGQESVVDGNHKLIESDCVLKKQTFDNYGSEECSKTTFVVSNDTASQVIEGSTKSQVEPNKERVKKGNASDSLMNIQPKISEISVMEEVQLARDIPSLPDVAVQGTEGVCEEEKLDPCSWNLALTERGTKCNGIADRKINCAHPQPQANRNHWDLNTMMDTWEGSRNHSALVHGVNLGAKRDIEHGIYSHNTTLNKSEWPLVACGKNTSVRSEDMSKLSTLSATDPQIKNDVLLHLSLSTSSCPQSGPSIETSHTSTSKVEMRIDPSNDSKVSKNLASVGNIGLAGSRIVKSEPLDEINKQVFQGRPVNSGKGRIVKSEPCVGYLQAHSKASLSRDMQLIAHGSVKSEPVCGFNEETLQLSEERLRNSELKIYNGVLSLSSRALPVPDVRDCATSLPITSQPVSCPSEDTLNQSELLANTALVPSTVDIAQKTTQIGGTDATGAGSDSVNHDVDKSEVANDIYGISRVESVSVHPDPSRVKATDKAQSDSHGHNDAAESDEEKINLFDDMQDDCSSDTDEELVAGRGVGDVVLTENQHGVDDDDDYEDGELREPLLHITSEVGEGPDKDLVSSYHEMLDNRDVSVSGCSAEGYSAHVEGRDVRLGNRGVIRSSCISEGFDGVTHHNQNTSNHTCLQVLSAVEEQSAVMGKLEPNGELLNSSGKEDLKVCENEFSDVTVSTSQGTTSLGGEQGCIVNQQDNVNGMKLVETKFSVWSKTEALVVGAEATKDVNSSKGTSSRIINLARAFSGPSPGRIRSFPGRFLPSRIERERYNDGLRNGDKLHPRGSRDDDGRNKFDRQRNQDYPLRSTASEFMHGRGRPEKRFDSPHAAVMVSRDGTVVSSGRKPLRDELPSFRNITSRRRSPRGRPVSHAAQVVRRSRDVSPGRCIGRGDPNLIGLRPEKKYMRRLPDDMINTVFSRSQVDDHFVSRERSYSPVHRKGPLHISRLRSNSPSRTRSPGPWSSPRRRSPDAFGRPELIHRRSPPFYRVKRMRSPHQRPVFSEDVDGRRHGSPPYISRVSNDLRDMSSSRETTDHQRSFIQNRSPSGRVLARGARRFDMLDPREVIENDEYFAGPMHSDRFHEIGPDGSADGRRICTDRRRSFRPTYDADVVEKFHFHVEAGPRPYRFSQEADAEFHEGGNMRDREFDRRVKNRSGNTPRSTRSGEEHDENYRHGEQGWEAAGFEDVSPAKRRRF